MNDINFKLIINTALLGMLIGMVELIGYLDDFIWLFWLSFWLFAAMVISKRKIKGHFLHGMITGAAAYMAAIAVKILGYDLYLQQSSIAIRELQNLPPDVNHKLYIASIGLLVALISGAVTGFFILGYQKLRNNLLK